MEESERDSLTDGSRLSFDPYTGCRPAGFRQNIGGDLCQDTISGPRLLPDAQSLSPSGRDSPGKPGGRNALVPECLYAAVQPAAQTFWSRLQRALQGSDWTAVAQV